MQFFCSLFVHNCPPRYLCMPESASVSSWALNCLFTHNNVSRMSHSPSVNAQKHGVYFHKNANLCGTLLGRNESSSAYLLMTLPVQLPIIRLSFASIAEWSWVHSMGFTTSDLQRNVMGQSTEMSPLVSMLFRTFLNPLKFFVEIFTF